MRLILLFLIIVSFNARPNSLSSSQASALNHLKTYCNACHGLGNLRFLWNQSAETDWDYLFTHQAPVAKKPWADAIQEVLDWPRDTAPKHGTPIRPGKDWMPQGLKREELDLADRKGLGARKLIKDMLAAGN